MRDIENKDDVKTFVDAFYTKVNADDLLAPVFNDDAKVEWSIHLEKMYRFWGTLLIGTMDYNGSPFDKHIGHNIKSEHFDRWLKLFDETIDTHFAGPKADEAKHKAKNIGMIFKYKLQGIGS